MIQVFSCSYIGNLLILVFKGWKECVPVARENLPGVQLGLASAAGHQAGRAGAVQHRQGAGDADHDPQPGERQHRERVSRLGQLSVLLTPGHQLPVELALQLSKRPKWNEHGHQHPEVPDAVPRIPPTTNADPGLCRQGDPRHPPGGEDATDEGAEVVRHRKHPAEPWSHQEGLTDRRTREEASVPVHRP